MQGDFGEIGPLWGAWWLDPSQNWVFLTSYDLGGSSPTIAYSEAFVEVLDSTGGLSWAPEDLTWDVEDVTCVGCPYQLRTAPPFNVVWVNASGPNSSWSWCVRPNQWYYEYWEDAIQGSRCPWVP